MIPFKSKLTRFRNIKNRNKAFDKLTDRQKRQEIAFDALNLLLSEKIKPVKGEYWNDKLHNIKYSVQTATEFQEELCNIKKNEGCRVCARGAVMLSTIRLGNKIKPRQEGVSDGEETTVKGFTMDDMFAMENQFEGGEYNSLFDPYEEKDKNLANILCNVIKNGNYKPSDEKDYIQLWNIKL